MKTLCGQGAGFTKWTRLIAAVLGVALVLVLLAVGSSCAPLEETQAPAAGEGAPAGAAEGTPAAPGASDLSGAGVLAISPSSFTIHLGGDTQRLTVNALLGCDWSSLNPVVATLVGDTTNVKAVTVTGVALGTAIIRANCSAANPTAAVSVLAPHTITPTPKPPTATPTRTITPTPVRLSWSPSSLSLQYGTRGTLTVLSSGAAPVCTFSTSNTTYVQIHSYTANTVTVGANLNGGAYITATCNVGTTRVNVDTYGYNVTPRPFR